MRHSCWIDAATGWYTAGPTPGTDNIHVLDSLGNGADATITIYAPQIDDLGLLPSDDLANNPPDLGGDGSHGGCGCQVGRAGAPVSSLAMLLLVSIALVGRRLQRRLAGAARG